MKIIYTIIVIAVLLLLFVGYMGYFSSYDVEEKEMGPYTVAYQEHTGPYTQVGSTMDRVYQALLSEGITNQLGFGLYLDNPAIVDKSKLRSEVGSIISGDDIQKLSTTTENYMVKTFPQAKSVVAEFPYKNMLSYMMAPMKMYSVLEDYMLENNIEWTENMPAIEIYDMENSKIIFVVGIPEVTEMETENTNTTATTTPDMATKTEETATSTEE